MNYFVYIEPESFVYTAEELDAATERLDALCEEHKIRYKHGLVPWAAPWGSRFVSRMLVTPRTRKLIESAGYTLVPCTSSSS